MINRLRWGVRVAWLGALVLGLMSRALNFHMTLGWIVALSLVIFAAFAFKAGIRIPLGVIAIFWAAAVVYVGINQSQWVLDNNHWTIQGVHVLLGVGAIGIAEGLAGALSRVQSAP
jgi:hypothetical protein